MMMLLRLEILCLLLFVSTATIANPGHLTPVDPYDDHNRVVFETLLADKSVMFGVLMKPSFKPEKAIFLSAKYQYDENGDVLFDDEDNPKNIEWYLEGTVAVKNIYYAAVEKNQKIRKLKRVKRLIIPIQKKDFDVIISAWQKVLKQTRYTDFRHSYSDGTNYIFFVYGMYGETHHPGSSAGIPEKMIKVFDNLWKFLESGDQGSVEYLEKAKEVSKEILTYGG